MSVWIVSKADIDAIVTVALRWTELGALEYMPVEAAQVLRVTTENATSVGTHLWRVNHDSYNYGGRRELYTPQELAETPEFEDAEEMPEYTFAAFPGIPAPEVVVRLTDYYRYQTQDDGWTESHLWTHFGAGDEPPFEARFIFAMEWYAKSLLGLAPADQLPDVGEERVHFPDDRFPAYQRFPWGLGEGDRQIFLSPAGQ